MHPRSFLNDVVVPNRSDWELNFSSERLAFNAIASVDALAAHIFYWLKQNFPTEVSGLSDDTAYREHLAKLCPDFGLLRDVAKTLKHVQLVRGKPEVSAADQIESRSLGWGEARWDEGRWGSPQQIIIETNKGDLRYAEQLVDSSIAYMDKLLRQLHI